MYLYLFILGIKLVYNLTQPSGERIQTIKVRCQNCTIPIYTELNPTETYNVIITSYMATGGGNISVLTEHLKNRQIGPSSTQSYKEYLKVRSPIYEETGIRIVVHQKNSNKSSANSSKQNAVVIFVSLMFFIRLYV